MVFSTVCKHVFHLIDQNNNNNNSKYEYVGCLTYFKSTDFRTLVEETRITIEGV